MDNSKATEYQIKVAAQLGIDVAGETIAVAAAKIGDLVVVPRWTKRTQPPTRPM
ncbi:MAG: hypothetical protein HYY01_10330 [Chloroflexi bacterium]|nr:hypothetical protein [Chloroflexota bacterium]